MQSHYLIMYYVTGSLLSSKEESCIVFYKSIDIFNG